MEPTQNQTLNNRFCFYKPHLKLLTNLAGYAVNGDNKMHMHLTSASAMECIIASAQPLFLIVGQVVSSVSVDKSLSGRVCATKFRNPDFAQFLLGTGSLFGSSHVEKIK